MRIFILTVAAILLFIIAFPFIKLTAKDPHSGKIRPKIKQETPLQTVQTKQTTQMNEPVVDLSFFKDALKNKGIELSSDDDYNKLLSAIRLAKFPVIVNNKVYDGIELTKEGETYFIKPKGADSRDKLEIITEKNVDPDTVLRTGDVTQDEILKIAYDNSDDASATQNKISEYLASAKEKGVIIGYEYDTEYDQLYITYPDQKIPARIEPSFIANSLHSVVKAYADPQEFSSSIVKEFEQLISDGNVLIIDPNAGTHDFIQLDIQNADVSAGNKKDANPTQFSFLTTLSQNIKEKLSSIADSSLAFASGSEGDVVTPKGKKVYFFQSTNDIDEPFTNLEISKVLQNFPGSAFYPFYQNDYTLEISKVRPSFGESIIPEFYDLMSDEKKDVLFLNFHGVPYKDEDTGLAKLRMQGERYDLGIEGTEDCARKKSDFWDRAELLQSKYGGEQALRVFTQSIPLSKAQKEGLNNKDTLSNFKKDSAILNVHGKIGGIDILPSFFSINRFPQKAITFFHVCYGGNFKDTFNSKVFLSTAGTSVSVTEVFFKDLEKISKYLLKDPKAKDVKVNEENIRNFNLLNDFSQDQKDIPEKDDLVSVYGRYFFSKRCALNKRGLCSIKLYGSNSGTIAVSPHVKSADGNKIVFNTPMNKDIPADQAVQIKFDEACTVPKDLDTLKPQWTSDTEISLNWMNKAYTEDWKDPNGPFALVTVTNDEAVSKESEIKLTGNKDCGCNEKGCSQSQCLKEPANIEYNANNPKTDFTFVMPCITDEYYETCKEEVSPKYVKIKKDQDPMPEKIKIGSECYNKSSFNESAVDEKGYGDGEACEETCKKSCPIFLGWSRLQWVNTFDQAVQFCKKLSKEELIYFENRSTGEFGPGWLSSEGYGFIDLSDDVWRLPTQDEVGALKIKGPVLAYQNSDFNTTSVSTLDNEDGGTDTMTTYSMINTRCVRMSKPNFSEEEMKEYGIEADQKLCSTQEYTKGNESKDGVGESYPNAKDMQDDGSKSREDGLRGATEAFTRSPELRQYSH